jgi:hypothetical protein
METIVFIFVSLPEDWGARASSVPRRASRSSIAGFNVSSRNGIRQNAEHCDLESWAHGYPFWTWFIDNPRSSSVKRL